MFITYNETMWPNCDHSLATSPALPNSILLGRAAIGRLLAVKHYGIFKTHLTGII